MGRSVIDNWARQLEVGGPRESLHGPSQGTRPAKLYKIVWLHSLISDRLLKE